MKKNSILLIALLVSGGAIAQKKTVTPAKAVPQKQAVVTKTEPATKKEFTINGELSDMYKDGCKVYLQNMMAENAPKDSATVVDGRFKFSGLLENDPEMRILTIVNEDHLPIFNDAVIIEKGILNLEIDNARTMSFLNSPQNDKYQGFRKGQVDLMIKAQELDTEMKNLYKSGALSPEMAVDMSKDMEKIGVDFSTLISKYIGDNIHNAVGEFCFLVYSEYLKPDQLNALYKQSNPAFQSSGYPMMIMEQKVWGREGLDAGGQFKDIELMSSLGTKAKVSSFIGKGKYVLIDFWASWCGPCRKEMPFIVNLYNRYKDKGFDIVGISLDEKKEAWLSSVKSMNMTWTQLSDLGGWESAAAKQYKITQIPQNFLLDKQGKIIATDLHGEELWSKLVELLGDGE